MMVTSQILKKHHIFTSQNLKKKSQILKSPLAAGDRRPQPVDDRRRWPRTQPPFFFDIFWGVREKYHHIFFKKNTKYKFLDEFHKKK